MHTLRSRAVHRAVAALAVAALATGCQVNKARQYGPMSTAAQERDGVGLLIRSGELAVAVASPETASPEVERIVRDAGGYVESSTAAKESHVWLRCRVPAEKLDGAMDAIAALGDEQHRSVSAADVTEQHADLQTRLRNNIALRDRLQQLLPRASDVEDVVAIEKELSRIQSEIETMQASFDRLESQIEQSALSVTLRPRRILGPFGYVAYGLWWAVSKLFVIR